MNFTSQLWELFEKTEVRNIRFTEQEILKEGTHTWFSWDQTSLILEPSYQGEDICLYLMKNQSYRIYNEIIYLNKMCSHEAKSEF